MLFEYQRRMIDLEYKDMTEVLNVVKEQKIFDLRHYVTFNQRDLRELICLPAPGVYPVNGVFPIVTFGPGALSRTAFEKRYVEDLTTFPEFTACRELVYNRGGRPLLACPPASLIRALAPEPVWNPNEIMILVARVYRYFKTLHRETFPTINVKDASLDDSDYLLPGAEADYLALGERGVLGYSQLIDDIDIGFVRQDVHHLYHIELNGTLLKISKGHDFRVAEYYKRIFDEIGEQKEYETGFR